MLNVLSKPKQKILLDICDMYIRYMVEIRLYQMSIMTKLLHENAFRITGEGNPPATSNIEN